MTDVSNSFFAEGSVVLPSGGPLYLQLKRWIEDAIHSGAINPGDALRLKAVRVSGEVKR